MKVKFVLHLDRQTRRAAAVDLVADERQVFTRQMHANLVRAARIESARDPGYRQSLNRAPAHAAGAGAGGLGANAGAAREALEARAAARIAADRRLNDEVGRGGAEREGPVFALHGALLKLANQIRLSRKRACDDHEARRITVKAVDDARAGHFTKFR